LRRKKFFLLPLVSQGYSPDYKAYSHLPNSHAQFKKVFSTIAKEIHTVCAKKKEPFFLVSNSNPRMDFYGILRRKTRTRLVEMPPEQALTKIQ